MKQQRVITLPAVLVGLASLACSLVGCTFVHGSGRVGEEARRVSDLAGVSLAMPGDLRIELGDEESLRVEAEDNLLPYIETVVENGTLKIRTPLGVILHPTEPIHLYLTAKQLDALAVSGSGVIEAPDLEAARLSLSVSGSGRIETGNLTADEIVARVSGSGRLEMAGGKMGTCRVVVSGSGNVDLGDLEADTLGTEVTGSGKVVASGGQVAEQRVTISGSGKYEARDLISAAAEIHISGSGKATVQASERLEVHLSGSGDVYYAGSPAVERSVSGSGSVSHIGD
jgi:hypothetical protein